VLSSGEWLLFRRKDKKKWKRKSESRFFQLSPSMWVMLSKCTVGNVM
jgi:hypothetical protein